MKAIIRISFVAAALASFMYAETSLAQNNVIVESDRVEYQKNTSLDFTEVNVEGNVVKPPIIYVSPTKKAHFRNLIELRGNFRPELHRSLGNM